MINWQTQHCLLVVLQLDDLKTFDITVQNKMSLE